MKRSRLRKSIWVVTLTLIVAAALALAACGSDTTASSPSSAAPSQAAASPSMASSATPLPAATVAGTFVFGKANEYGMGEIYVIRGDGTGLQRVASKSGYSLDGPVWSPDGTRIAYNHSGKGNIHGDAYTVWAMNADGSDQRKLTTGAARGYDVAWSPDGAQVAYHSSSPQVGSGIFVVNADGGGLRRVTDENDGNLEWAPSAKIHFIRGGDDIYAVRADGTGLTPLTKDADVSAFALSPDGKRFAIYDTLADRIVLLPADGDGAPVTVVDQVAAKGYVPQKFGVAYGVALSWSPDGETLAFAVNGADGNSGSALYVVNADGSGLSVVPNTGMLWEPVWQPE